MRSLWRCLWQNQAQNLHRRYWSLRQNRYNKARPEAPTLAYSPLSFGEPSQVIEGINPSRMAIRPDRLDCVAADVHNPEEFYRLRSKGLFRTLVKLAHDIHLS